MQASPPNLNKQSDGFPTFSVGRSETKVYYTELPAAAFVQIPPLDRSSHRNSFKTPNDRYLYISGADNMLRLSDVESLSHASTKSFYLNKEGAEPGYFHFRDGNQIKNMLVGHDCKAQQWCYLSDTRQFRLISTPQFNGYVEIDGAGEPLGPDHMCDPTFRCDTTITFFNQQGDAAVCHANPHVVV